MKAPLKIKILASSLIALFSLITLGVLSSISTKLIAQWGIAALLLEAIICFGFLIGGIGLYRLNRWGRKLVIALCAVRVIQFFIWLSWVMYMKFATGSATSSNALISYIVASLFYFAVAIFLRTDSVKRSFSGHDAA
jgi:hypothetical protein